VAARLTSGQTGLATIPEPTLSGVMMQNADLHVVADLTAEWQKIHPEVLLSQGSQVIRKDFIEQNPEAAAAFLAEYQASAEAVNVDVADTAVLTGKFDIVPEKVAAMAIPAANQVFIDGEEMKRGSQPFFQILFEANPESVGGALPGDDFYLDR
jgi:NitT/TauT family transport system substrate-binding protein